MNTIDQRFCEHNHEKLADLVINYMLGISEHKNVK
jgi:hypothetical protein